MAITATLLTSGSDNTDATSWATASITPPANELLLVAVTTSGVAAATAPTLTLAGNSLTWVEVVTRAWDALSIRRTSLFRAMGASPASGAVTITASASCAGVIWIIATLAGVDTSGTNGSGAIVQSASVFSDNQTTSTVTLSAFADAVNNAAFGAFAGDSDLASIAPEGGYTELAEVGMTLPTQRMNAQWKLGEDTSVSASQTTPVADWGSVAAEIKAAAAATGHPTMRRWGGVPYMTPGPVRPGRSW